MKKKFILKSEIDFAPICRFCFRIESLLDHSETFIFDCVKRAAVVNRMVANINNPVMASND